MTANADFARNMQRGKERITGEHDDGVVRVLQRLHDLKHSVLLSCTEIKEQITYRAAVSSGLAREGDEASKREPSLHPLARVLAVSRRAGHAPKAQREHAQALESERLVARCVPARTANQKRRVLQNATM